ncbi:formate dehydrogenase accessory sulfurtransferase FdhD [Marinomonas sp. IMCC 4694]|nr:formate dehydrogenase accessory sulfurtransferase FdhD [Marinomonas sp. IMCC 4694]
MQHSTLSFPSHKSQTFDRGDLVSDHAESVELVVETPLAISVNGIVHAVMMVTPSHLDAFVIGFVRTEGIVRHLDDIRDMEWQHTHSDLGIHSLEINLVLSPRRFAQFKQRKHRHLGASGCGLCGVESLDQALPALDVLPFSAPIDQATLARLKTQLSDRQTLGKLTGAIHAALLISPQGEPIFCMEDIGRHNALDKVIGYALQQGIHLHNHSVVMTSRCSTELIQKAVRVGLSRLIHLASPSTLAVKLAQHYGLTLIHLPKQDAPRVFASSQPPEGKDHEQKDHE